MKVSAFVLSISDAQLQFSVLRAVIYCPVGFYSSAEAAGQRSERTLSILVSLPVSKSFYLAFLWCADATGPNADSRSLPYLPPVILRLGSLVDRRENVDMTCAANELTTFSLLSRLTYSEHKLEYISVAGGYVLSSDTAKDC